jgi:hypothetical protein
MTMGFKVTKALNGGLAKKLNKLRRGVGKAKVVQKAMKALI